MSRFIVESRRGITLLEVLIAIGILSIGLLSVLCLLPAGRTYLVKAEADDRVSAVVPAAMASCDALGLFKKDSLEWVAVPGNPVEDGERPTHRDNFLPYELLVEKLSEDEINRRRAGFPDDPNYVPGEYFVPDSAAILDVYPSEPEPTRVRGRIGDPEARNAKVRVTRKDQDGSTPPPYETTCDGNGRWSSDQACKGMKTAEQQVYPPGHPKGGTPDPATAYMEYTFTAEWEHVDPTTGKPEWLDAGGVTVEHDTPNLRADKGHWNPYRHYGVRIKELTTSYLPRIDLREISPADTTNNTPDAATFIEFPDFDSIAGVKKNRLIKSVTRPVSGELWRFQRGIRVQTLGFWWLYTINQTTGELEVDKRIRTWATPFWDNPTTNPLEVWQDGFQIVEDAVDFFSFKIGAGERFDIDWTPSTSVGGLIDPLDPTQPPFRAWFTRGGGSPLDLHPWYQRLGNKLSYQATDDGIIIFGVGLEKGPVNTVGYDVFTNTYAIKNVGYRVDVTRYRNDRMVAIDPIGSAYLDRVMGPIPAGTPEHESWRVRRQRFGYFENWERDNDVRSIIIPRLNWHSISQIPDLNAAVAYAEHLCRPEDNVEVHPPRGNDEDAASEPGFVTVSATDPTPLRRDVAGRMSWLVTLQPQDYGSVAANWEPGKWFDASIVLFQDRRLPKSRTDAFEGEYAFEAGWSDFDGTVRIYVKNDRSTGKPLIEEQDLEQVFKSGAWFLLAPSIPTAAGPIDDQMRFEWLRVVSSRIERRRGNLIMTILPDKEPHADVLLRGVSRPVIDDDGPRLPLVCFAYDGILAVIHQPIKVQP